MDAPQVKSLEEAQTHIDALWRSVRALEKNVRMHELYLDTFVWTPWWKRWLFIIDGWSGHEVVEAPKWRPWRRWWTS
jgi:hypothetical protein